jgi:hypothetical protein
LSRSFFIFVAFFVRNVTSQSKFHSGRRGGILCGKRNAVELSSGKILDRRPQRENKKNKHLTLEDRTEIQQCLMHGMTFKTIAGGQA